MKRHLADIDRTTLEGARDYALLSVALLTGRRRAELVGIRWSSLHFLDDRIKLTWKVKGARTEHDLLPRSASGALLRFLHHFYGQDLATVAPDAAVWPSLSDRNYGAPISGQTLADICKRRLDFSAVHQIRHTFAKELEERGVKPSEIQRRLGHQSLRTTIYLGRLSSAENPVSEAMADDLGIE
jgi:integrase/recombinase XerD